MFTSTPPSRGTFGTRAAAFAPDFAVQGRSFWMVYNQHPDMVNGNVADFRYIFVTAGLAAAYHWVVGAAMAIAAADAAALRDIIINEACFISVMLVAAGGDAVQHRKAALLVAAARRAMRRSWGFVAGDIEATQRFEVHAAGAVDPVLTAAGVLSADIAGRCTVAEYAAERAALDALWTPDVDVFLTAAMRIGSVMPITTGICLVASGGHHFVDPHKAAARGAIKQVLGGRETTAWEMPVEAYEDALGHKAAHPVRTSVAVFLAREAETKRRLIRIGMAAVALRVPAKFSPQKSADALQALVVKSAEAMANACVAVNAAPVNQLVTGVAAALANPDIGLGLQAADELVTAFKTAHGGNVAWCAGFMSALYTATDVPRSSQTLTNAYAVRSAGRDNGAMFAMGANHYANFARWERARAKEGYLTGYGLFGAAAPADRHPPDVAGRAAAGAAPAVGAAVP